MTHNRSAEPMEARIEKRDDSLDAQPIRLPLVSLDSLLDGVTESNRHSEVDTGPPTGSEIW